MAVQITIEQSITKSRERLERIGKGRLLDKALLRALNNTAYDIRSDIAAGIQRVFDRPTPYAQRAALAVPARSITDAARVKIKDEGGKGNAPEKFLSPEIYGGSRNSKGHERALRAAGLLPNGIYTTPGPDAPLDQYGNLRGGIYVQILSAVRAAETRAGYISNITPSSRIRNKKPRGYFVIPWGIQRGKLRPGVYLRDGRRVKWILKFVRTPQYRQRLDFFGIADKAAQSRFDRQLMRAVEFELERELKR